ncbi:MAG: P-loop NTPase [Bacteroidales bacterium]
MRIEVAVVSGKGGTGKSSISSSFATMGERVVVADCDVDAANMHLILNPKIEATAPYLSGEEALIDSKKCTGCGVCVEHCRFDAISYSNGVCVVDPIACDGCKLCYRVCPEEAITMIPNDKSKMLWGSFRYGKMVYGRLEPGEENSGKLVAMVREKSSQIAEESAIKKVIIDSPAGIGCSVIAAISGITHLVIVTEPSLSALSDLIRLLTLIKGYKFKKGVIINKCDIAPIISEEIEEICAAEGIPILTKIPFSREIVEAMVNGKSIVEWAPQSKISDSIKGVWDSFL